MEICICSERLSKSHKSTRRFLFFYPRWPRAPLQTPNPLTQGAWPPSFLYYYLSVYVNLSKNASSLLQPILFERKRMQRYAFLRYLPNFFAIIFSQTRKFSRFMTKTPLVSQDIGHHKTIRTPLLCHFRHRRLQLHCWRKSKDYSPRPSRIRHFRYIPAVGRHTPFSYI